MIRGLCRYPFSHLYPFITQLSRKFVKHGEAKQHTGSFSTRDWISSFNVSIIKQYSISVETW